MWLWMIGWLSNEAEYGKKGGAVVLDTIPELA
jgi:hypothetical protein